MVVDKNFTLKFVQLRQRAEAYLSAPSRDAEAMCHEDVRKLVHELDTYQIELELQNEELRNAQQQLEESRKKYYDLYEFAPVGYLTLSENGLILKANLTASDMLGLSRAHMIRHLFSAYVFKEDQDIFYRSWRKLLESYEKQTFDIRIVKKDGAVFYALVEMIFRPEIAVNTGEFQVSLSDISRRKLLESALLKSKKEWETTFDAMSEIVTLIDINFNILRANKAAHDITNVKYGEIIGKECYRIFAGLSSPCKDCPMVESLIDKKHHRIENILHSNLDKVFSVSCSPVLDKNGSLEYIVHIAVDITEKKLLEEKLFQSHKMEAIGTLAGGIAHDFNNILAVLIGFAEIIDEDIPVNSPSKINITKVLESANLAKELVRQILTFSRKGHSIKKLLQPSLIINEAINLMRATIPSSINMDIEMDNACNLIYANPTHVHQVIVNLVTNAYHSLENEKGVIAVKLKNIKLNEEDIKNKPGVLAGSFVQLIVKDSGCGMDQSIIDRIFEPYYTTKEVGKGTGMGLAIVHGIVANCGGFITVESKKGKGTTFYVYFPAVKEKPIQKEKIQGKLLLKGNERILTVDDDKNLANMYKTLLECQGYKVTTSYNSLMALSLFKTSPYDFDLILTDQTMPGLTGEELINKIIEIRPDIPILLCTGYSNIISEERAKEIGVKRFLMKPIERISLLTAIREVLDESMGKNTHRGNGGDLPRTNTDRNTD